MKRLEHSNTIPLEIVGPSTSKCVGSFRRGVEFYYSGSFHMLDSDACCYYSIQKLGIIRAHFMQSSSHLDFYLYTKEGEMMMEFLFPSLSDRATIAQ
jgi:hypothetical protein